MIKRVFHSIAAAALLLASPVGAATYTYGVDYAFPITRTAGLGSAASPRAGRGSVSGTFTIGDGFGDTNFDLLAFDLVSVNTTGGFATQPTYTYTSSVPADAGSARASGLGSFSSIIFSFTNPDSAVPGSAGLISPPNVQNPGQGYSINASSLTLFVSRSFRAGDTTFSLLGNEIIGRAPLNSGRGFADLGYEFTANVISFAPGGTLLSTDPGNGGPIAPVPVPAALPLLAGALAFMGFGLRRRRRT